MIKRLFIVFFCIVGIMSASKACDACGCAASGIGIGLMTDYRSNFIRISYLDTRFRSNPDHAHYNSSDVFSRVDLSFRYTFEKLPKVRLVGHIPYGYNKRTNDDTESSLSGLSDIQVLVNYVLFNKMSPSGNSSYYIEGGGGFTLPTGKYDAKLIDKNLPDNFNLGNGSLGYIVQLNAVANFEQFGIVANSDYQLNSNTKEGYHFGNQFSNQLTAFREFPIGSKVKLIPNVGLLYEDIASDKYSNGNRVPETGGNGLFFSSAINFKTDKWLAGVSYSLPIAQSYSGGSIDAGQKLAVHISFLF